MLLVICVSRVHNDNRVINKVMMQQAAIHPIFLNAFIYNIKGLIHSTEFTNVQSHRHCNQQEYPNSFGHSIIRGGWKRSRELPRATKIIYAKSVF